VIKLRKAKPQGNVLGSGPSTSSSEPGMLSLPDTANCVLTWNRPCHYSARILDRGFLAPRRPLVPRRSCPGDGQSNAEFRPLLHPRLRWAPAIIQCPLRQPQLCLRAPQHSVSAPTSLTR
jgi:hypothetical protein